MSKQVSVTGLVFLLACSNPRPSAGFERSGARLVNPYGFEIVAPPASFVDNPALAAKFDREQMTCQVWQDARPTGGLLALCGGDKPVRSREDLVLIADGIRDGMLRQISAASTKLTGKSGFDEPTVHWNGKRGDVAVKGLLVGLPVRSRVLSSEDGLAYVLAISLTESTTATDPIVDSLRSREE